MGSRNEPYEAPAIRAFASEVTAWRTGAGLNKTALAETLGYTSQWIGQIEAAKSIPSWEFAENLDSYFKTNGVFKRQHKRIVDTRHQAILPPGFAEYQEREQEANQLHAFDLTLFRGLLRTENYARSILSYGHDAETTERLVDERLARQELLAREDPPHAWFTIDEAVLRCVVGRKEVMREQLAHILELSQRPNISIDIVRRKPRYYPGLTGGFVILGFRNAPDVAYAEMAGRGMLVQEPKTVAEFAILYSSLRGHALDVEESRTVIESIMKEHG